MVLENVFLQVLCATVEDEPRFRDLIGQWISEGSVPEFPAFVGESKKKRQSRKRRYKEEAKEAEEALREMGADTSEYGMKEGMCVQWNPSITDTIRHQHFVPY